MRITRKRAVFGLVGLLLGGMLFAWSGLFNVAASSGHWAVTDWFLHWVMRNSVATWTRIEAPEQPVDPAGLISAAGLYDQSCAACHGAPGVSPLPVMQAAIPAAPDLADKAPEWTDAQLFWIIKHGVKFTGMPAWAAAHRDDEIRRMAGFVRGLPGMSPARYRALTRDPRETGADPLLAGCTGCHGVDGLGRGGEDIPVLGGQAPAVLEKALADYASGVRPSAVMANAAARLTPADRRRLASHFAALPGLPGGRPAASRDSAEQLYHHGLAERELPACARCHDGNGTAAPRLTGQKAAYVAGRLRAWQAEEAVEARLPSDTMAVIARRIPEEMIDMLAQHVDGTQ